MLDLAVATAVDYDALARAIGTEFGKLDGVVHAAAQLGDRTPLEQYDVPTWCKVLHVNLTAPFILTQVLLPSSAQIRGRLRHIRQQRRGEAIRGRSGAHTPSPRAAWSRCAAVLAEELQGEPNIRVNSVNPGRMRTAMRAAAYPAEDPNTLPTPASVSGPFLYLLSARGREY